MAILYDVYWNVLGDAFTTQDAFLTDMFDFVTGSLTFPATITGMINYDYVPNATKELFEEYNKQCVINKDVIMGKIHDALAQIASRKELDKKEINEGLINTVSHAVNYGRIRAPKKKTDYIDYDADEKNRLFTYLIIKKDNFDLEYNLFLLLTFAISKKLPKNFNFGAGYREYLQEFDEQVTCMYGVTSTPGIARIITLSTCKRPNPFAIFSYADLLYYGYSYGIRRNYSKCYRYYKMAGGLEGLEENDPDKSFCHPLALFSAAFLLLIYKDTEKENYEEYVSEIQDMTKTQRYDAAAKFADAAFVLTGSEAAANTLGRIASTTEEDVPGIEDIKKRYHLKDSDYYFAYAADKNYVYATNNLALKHQKLAFVEPEKAQTHLDEYIRYLKKSADKYDPWAANRLGEIYRTGDLKLQGQTLHFDHIIDRDLAFRYYKQSTDKFNSVDSAWAYAHLVIDYPEKFKNDEGTLKRYLKAAFSLKNSGATDYIKNSFKTVYNKEIPDLG